MRRTINNEAAISDRLKKIWEKDNKVVSVLSSEDGTTHRVLTTDKDTQSLKL
jgi:hypothetical protein